MRRCWARAGPSSAVAGGRGGGVVLWWRRFGSLEPAGGVAAAGGVFFRQCRAGWSRPDLADLAPVARRAMEAACGLDHKRPALPWPVAGGAGGVAMAVVDPCWEVVGAGCGWFNSVRPGRILQRRGRWKARAAGGILCRGHLGWWRGRRSGGGANSRHSFARINSGLAKGAFRGGKERPFAPLPVGGAVVRGKDGGMVADAEAVARVVGAAVLVGGSHGLDAGRRSWS